MSDGVVKYALESESEPLLLEGRYEGDKRVIDVVSTTRELIFSKVRNMFPYNGEEIGAGAAELGAVRQKAFNKVEVLKKLTNSGLLSAGVIESVFAHGDSIVKSVSECESAFALACELARCHAAGTGADGVSEGVRSGCGGKQRGCVVDGAVAPAEAFRHRERA
jgi:hypothetical protein